MENNIAPMEVSILPQSFGAGNYNVMLISFDFDQTIEKGVIMRIPSIIRLACENEKLVENGNKIVWELLQSHKAP